MLIRAKTLDLLYRVRLLLGRLIGASLDGGDFYINGSDSLPAPMTAAEEAEFMPRLAADPSLYTVLVERNLRLVVYIAKKFENTGTGLEDLVSIGAIGLMKAAKTYRPDKNIKFATYGSRCAENEILMYLRKNQNSRADVSIDEPLHIDWDGNELLLSDVLSSDGDSVWHDLEGDEERRVLHEAVSRLDERERVIVELRFGIGGGRELTQKEVAGLLGISQSYISRLEKKIIGDLREALAGKI